MNDKKEVRFFAENLQVRNDNDSEKMIVEGYAVVFDSPATHGFTEIIDRNAFNGCDMKDVPLKYNHDDSHLILARTRNNSLSLSIDDKGLLIRAELINTTSNIDIYKSIQAGLFYDTTSIYARALSTLDSEKKKLDNLRAKRELSKRKLLLNLKIKEIGGI